MATKHGYEALSEALVASQLSGVPFSALSTDTPQSVEAAAMVQADVARALGSQIAGWKLGFVPNSGTAVSAPLFGNLILPDGGVYARGAATFLAIEAEIGFRLTGDPGAPDPHSSLGSAFVGIEIVRSRFTEAGKAPFMAFLADNIGNGAYVIGPQRDNWHKLALNGLRCRVWADDRLIHDAVGGHPQNDPLAPLRAYASDPTDRLGGLRGGQFITTGTLCGVVAINEPCRIRVEVEQFGEVSVELRS